MGRPDADLLWEKTKDPEIVLLHDVYFENLRGAERSIAEHVIAWGAGEGIRMMSAAHRNFCAFGALNLLNLLNSST